MNERDEQRVIEALQALTGGLTVTEQDIVASGARLRNSLEPPPPRRRLALVAAAAVAILVAGVAVLLVINRDDDGSQVPVTPVPSPADTLIAALQSDAYGQSPADFLAGEVPTRGEMAGAWFLRWYYDPIPLIIDGDGDWFSALPEEPAMSGPSTLVGDTWTRRVAGSPNCGDGGSLPWRTALAADGSLHLDFAGTTNTCTPADNREVWDRIGPGSPIADYLLAMATEVTWQTRTDWSSSSSSSPGVYVAPESGHLLGILEDGSYSYYDDLTARQLASSCSGGPLSASVELARTPEVDGYLYDAELFRFSTTEAGCASTVADQGLWVRLGQSVFE